MKKLSLSEKVLDKQISQLEDKLSELKKKKLAVLQGRLHEAQRAMNELQSGIKGGASYPILRTSKTPPTAKGGPRGPRLSSEDVVERLTKAVKAAGSEGISARSAAENAGVFYLRAIKVMDENFVKTGSGKWTRYRIK
jgi:hypothetical protein